jgi:hypothetical protein
MALETRPIPEFTGQVAIDFYEKVKHFSDGITLEKVLGGVCMIAKQREKLGVAESKEGLKFKNIYYN